MRPTLLNSCAKAATAAEVRFRIDAPIAPSRGTRVVALDDGAIPVLSHVANGPWATARFFTCDVPPGAAERDHVQSGAAERDGWLDDVVLRRSDGTLSRLSEELVGCSAVVMIATADGGPAAAAIGEACILRGIMTAGLVLGEGPDASAAISALRPYARVLMVSADEHDVAEVLTALRA